jgi:hypothetical protein
VSVGPHHLEERGRKKLRKGIKREMEAKEGEKERREKEKKRKR